MTEKIAEAVTAKVQEKQQEEKEDKVPKLDKQQTIIGEPDDESEQQKSEVNL